MDFHADADLTDSVARAGQALLREQKADGHFVFELEADATIPAEYVLLEHYLDRIDAPLQQRIGVYLRGIQGEHGGWPLFHDGVFNISASVKAYFALKAIGDDPGAPHMARAREAILRAGGAERTNVFTRAQLALFGQVPWRAVPVMPLEIMHLPLWFPFHLSKVSYWSRTVIVPLLVLMALRPVARNPHGVAIKELFRTPPEQVRDYIRGPYHSAWGRVFRALDSVLRVAQPYFPKRGRDSAISKAVAFVTERLNGEDGLGAIYPAMANSVMMFDALGYPPDHPEAAIAWQSVRNLVVDRKDRVDGEITASGEALPPAPALAGEGPPSMPFPRPAQQGVDGGPSAALTMRGDPVTSPRTGRAYCQPCVSPVWDTGLAGHALAEAGLSTDSACDWLIPRQILEVVGDWSVRRPGLRPGGWAFQYANPHYPDVDDTAVVGLLLHRNGNPSYAPAIERAREWVIGMQSSDGGWGAFEPENTHLYLNHIPFADHGALLDPPTADVSARCVSFLAQIGMTDDDPVIRRALAYLRKEQEADGSWFGRWGTNYIYGTWSVLCALNAAGVPHDDPAMVKAVAWLESVQRPDGGWGEDEESYGDAPHGEYKESTPSQTAWAVLGLMAAGAADHDSAARGIAWLTRHQKPDGSWDEKPYTAVGFPRVFYLRYHGYKLYFPLMAMARYSNLMRGNTRKVEVGF